jgi:Uma2 family endonuclease
MATILERKKKPRSARSGQREPTWAVSEFFPMQGDWTESDFLALERICGNRMIELANGCLEVLPMPDLYHQRIVKWLLGKVDEFILPSELGEAMMAPLPIKLFPGQMREPDIAFFGKHRILDLRDPPLGADLVMEIVSPGNENRERDLEDKRVDYAKAKIPEYWIVDPETKTITVLTLSGKSYKVHGEFKAGQTAASKLLKGFKVAVRDVFAAGDAKG